MDNALALGNDEKKNDYYLDIQHTQTVINPIDQYEMLRKLDIQIKR